MTQAMPDRQRAATGGEDGPSNEPDASRATATRILELIDSSVLDSIRKVSPPEDKLLARVVGLYSEHAPQHLEPLDQTGPADTRTVGEPNLAHKSRSQKLDKPRMGDLDGRAGRMHRKGASFEPETRRVRNEDLPPTLDVSAVLVSEEVRPHRPSEPVKPSSGATEA